MRSRASADSSAPDSIARRRASIWDSTCARSSLSPAPTARLSSGVAGFSQLSVICARTPDLRPSQASRNDFHADSSWMAPDPLSKRARTSAKSGATAAAVVTPRSERVLVVALLFVGIEQRIRLHRGARRIVSLRWKPPARRRRYETWQTPPLQALLR